MKREDATIASSSPSGIVYILGSVDESMFKIGWTDDITPERRFEQHRANTIRGIQMIALCYVRAMQSDEFSLHREFRRYKVDRYGKEVFHAKGGLLGYVQWLMRQPFVQIDPSGKTPPSLVDSTHWLPRPERTWARTPSLLISDEPWSWLPRRDTTGDDYYTPMPIIDVVREVFGEIDLDPASHVFANLEIRARRFFTIQDNGLTKPWSGRVFVNPPFSQWEEWSEKIISECASGRIEGMIVLAASRTQTAQYFKKLLDACEALVILTGRYKFGGKGGSSPDDGHILLYFGSGSRKFLDAFGRIGGTFLKDRFSSDGTCHDEFADRVQSNLL